MSIALMLLLVIGTAICAVQAIRAARLLIAAIWLAGASALVALMMYGLGAHEVAVIELSVGAGLVTVLFVFAINIAGEEGIEGRPVIPNWLAWGLTVAAPLLLLALALPLPFAATEAGNTSFAGMLWQDRGLDALAQVVLIFGGVLGVLGLLSERKVAAAHGDVEVEAVHAAPNGKKAHPLPEAAMLEKEKAL